MKFKTIQRGYGYWEFRDRNSEPCVLQDSSLATEACVWLGAEKLRVNEFKAGEGWSEVEFAHSLTHHYVGNERMHLSRKQVKRLLLLKMVTCRTRKNLLNQPKMTSNNPEQNKLCERCKGNGRIEMLEHCPKCKGSGFESEPAEPWEGLDDFLCEHKDDEYSGYYIEVNEVADLKAFIRKVHDQAYEQGKKEGAMIAFNLIDDSAPKFEEEAKKTDDSETWLLARSLRRVRKWLNLELPKHLTKPSSD